MLVHATRGCSLMAHTAVMIMAKAPYPGQVKTRLCPPLTPGQAAALSRAFLCNGHDARTHPARARAGEGLERAVPPPRRGMEACGGAHRPGDELHVRQVLDNGARASLDGQPLTDPSSVAREEQPAHRMASGLCYTGTP